VRTGLDWTMHDAQFGYLVALRLVCREISSMGDRQHRWASDSTSDFHTMDNILETMSVSGLPFL